MFPDGITYGLSMVSGGQAIIFMAIFIAIFVASEFSHGTMKNAVSKGFPRHQIYLSKIITMITATYIMLFLMFVFGTISAAIITGKFGELSGDFVGHMLMITGIELLLHAALTAVYVLIANTIRNYGGAIAINIIGVSTFGVLIYQLLELLFKNKIRFTTYSLQHNINYFSPSLTQSGEDILRAVIVGVAFLTVTTVLGILAFKNTDVK
jgi:ABC-2 type transport system permease protein